MARHHYKKNALSRNLDFGSDSPHGDPSHEHQSMTVC